MGKEKKSGKFANKNDRMNSHEGLALAGTPITSASGVAYRFCTSTMFATVTSSSFSCG
jgi:hypothetical protein